MSRQSDQIRQLSPRHVLLRTHQRGETLSKEQCYLELYVCATGMIPARDPTGPVPWLLAAKQAVSREFGHHPTDTKSLPH